MNPELLAKLDKQLRAPLARLLPPNAYIKLYSSTRAWFHKQLVANPPKPIEVPTHLATTLWGINFRSPILNAAGMFKNGKGYELVAAQGAGAYLSGTSTALKRTGNHKAGIKLPFTPYPTSNAASNWLGLPNDSDITVANRLAKIKKTPGCPIGASLMGAPELIEEDKLTKLIEALFAYTEANVDFIEINESCPNVQHKKTSDTELADRLREISKDYLKKEDKPFIPVVLKFSNDTEVSQVPELIKLITELGFSGINFGNTSTDYNKHRPKIKQSEQKVYDYFTSTFLGGVSGKPLQDDSLRLVRAAADYLEEQRSSQDRDDSPESEFHIVQTGGVSSAGDVRMALDAGASLCQWYTGYFEGFSEYGHGLYKEIFYK